MDEKKEVVYLVDGETYLHLKETATNTGFAYETFDKATGAAQCTGLITYEDMLENPIRNPIACARVMAIEEIGLKGEGVAEVALRTLDQLKDAKRAYRKAHRDDPHDHSIRFINSSYDEQFRIPNGAHIRVDYPDMHFIAKCSYIDNYHTRIGNEVFHICQFAELLECSDGVARPEPEIDCEQAAWKVGQKEYLSIQSTEDGWNYSLYNQKFGELDGGQIDLKSISILECRDMILQDLGWQNRFLKEEDYDLVEERAADAAEERLSSVLEQLREKKSALADRPSSEKGKAIPQRKKEECL